MVLSTAVLGMVSTTATKATAQYTNPYTGNTWNNPVSSYLDTVMQGNMQMQNLMINQSIQRNALERSIESQEENREQSPDSVDSNDNQEVTEEDVTSHAPETTISFHPVARSVIPQKIADKFSQTPEEKQEYEQLFTKLLEYYESYVQERKWQLHDVAHAVSYYIGANYYVYTGKDLDAEQAWGLYNSVAKILAQTEVAQSSDAQKQEVYELMAIQGALPLIGYNSSQAEGDREAIAKFRQNAKQNLEKLLGVPVAKLQLTSQGIVIDK